MKSRMRRRLGSVAAFVVGSVVIVTTCAAATYPYVNDFSVTGFENTNDHPGFETFTLDSGNGELAFQLPTGVSGGNRVSTTSVVITDEAIETSDFVVSTRVTIENSGRVVATSNTAVGFGVLSNTSDFATTAGSTYYLTDWFIHSNVPAAYGRLRIHAQGDAGGFTSQFGDSDDPSNWNGASIPWGSTYELRLTGVYDAGALNLTLAVFDEEGNLMGTPATATDNTPFSGDYFGLRNAVSNHATNLNMIYDDFRVTPAAELAVGVPEPGSFVLLAAAVAAGALFGARRRMERAQDSFAVQSASN